MLVDTVARIVELPLICGMGGVIGLRQGGANVFIWAERSWQGDTNAFNPAQIMVGVVSVKQGFSEFKLNRTCVGVCSSRPMTCFEWHPGL